jgi:hypothetical protein
MTRGERYVSGCVGDALCHAFVDYLLHGFPAAPATGAHTAGFGEVGEVIGAAVDGFHNLGIGYRFA